MGVGKEVSFKETFYVSHGNPAMLADVSFIARNFLLGWKKNVFPIKPKSILVVSAHWETDVPSVSAGEHPDVIYDFSDVPDCMFQMKYPAPGSPKLAKRVQELLIAGGFKTASLDESRGFDHSSWVPLSLMYPEADIPVCQLSVQPHLSASHHFDIGRALAPLKEEGVLFIGSGGAVHPSDDTPHWFDGVAPWAAEFDQWLEDALINGRYDDVNNYQTKAPSGWKIAHPIPEHFLPLHVAMGAAGEKSKAELIYRTWDHGTLGYASYKFTSI